MSIIQKFIQKITGKEEDKKSSSKSVSKDKSITVTNPHISQSGKVYTRPSDLAKVKYYYSADRAKKTGKLADYYKNQMEDEDSSFHKYYGKQQEYNQKYAEEHTSKRGTLDRILGVLGYNGITQGLYNITDDDENTTFVGGLKEGVKYWNPATDDVSGRKTFSDVLKNLGWEDKDPDHLSGSDVGRGVVGFVGDVLTDPLTYLNPFSAGAKIVKGSGYGLDAVKATKEATHSKSFAEVAKYLSDAGNNADKIKYMNGTTADDFIKAASYDKSLTPEQAKETAQRMSDYFNKDIQKLRLNPEDEGLSIGIGHLLPFDEKRRKALNKEIISSKSLRQLGDSTISPYYNSLAKKIRTSKMGQRFSKRSQTEAQVAKSGIDKTTKLYALGRSLKGWDEAAKDANDYDVANTFYQTFKDNDEGELLDIITSIEDGSFSDMRNLLDIKEAAFNKAYKKVNDNEYIKKSDGSRINKTQDEIMGEMKFDDEIGEFENTKSLLQQKREALDNVEKFIKKNENLITDDFTKDIYRLTGKTYNKDSSASELAEALLLHNKYQKSGGFLNILKNMQTDDIPDTIKKAYDSILKNGDENAARRTVLNSEKEKLQTAIAKAAKQAEEDSLEGKNIIDAFNKFVDENNMQLTAYKEFVNLNSLSYEKYIERKKFISNYTQRHLNDYYAIKRKYGGSDEVEELIKERQNIWKKHMENTKTYDDIVKKYNIKDKRSYAIAMSNMSKTESKLYHDTAEKIREFNNKYSLASDNLQNKIYNFINSKTDDALNDIGVKSTKDIPSHLTDGLKRIDNELSELDKTDSIYKTDFVKPNFDNLTVKEMRNLAKDLGIKNYSHVNRADIISKLDDYYNTSRITDEGWQHIIDNASPSDLKKLVDGIKNDREYKKLSKWLDEAKTIQQKIDDYFNSESFQFFKDADHLMTDKRAAAVGKSRVGQYVEELPEINDRLGHIEGIINAFKRGEINKEAFTVAQIDAINVFMDRMNKIAKEEIKAGVMTEEQLNKFYERYFTHILKNKDKAASAIIEKTNGSFKQFWQFASRGFSKSRKTNMVVDSIDENGERIFKTAIWDVYLERALTSNQILANKNIVSFINDMFSKPLKNNLDSAEKGYVKGMFYEDMQKTIKSSLSHLVENEKKTWIREMWETYTESPDEFLNAMRVNGWIPEHLESNLRSVQKRVSDLEHMIERNMNEKDFAFKYSNNKNMPYVDRSELEIQLKESKEQLEKADEAFKQHIGEAIEKNADNYIEAVKDEIIRPAYDEIVTHIFGEKKESAGRIKFTANNAITVMTDDEIRRFNDYFPNINLSQYDSDAVELTNQMSKMQQAELQPKLLNLYDEFLKGWKITNSLISPSFHVQNAASNAFQSFLSIGADALNPKSIKLAKNILATNDPYQTVKIAGQEYTYQKLNRMAKKYGVIDENFAAYDFGKDKPTRWELGQRNAELQKLSDVKWIDSPIWNSVVQASTVVGSNLESIQRMNLWLGRLKQGDDWEEAARKVNQFLFDYSDLTDFEQNVMKRVIPFYTFMRKNIPMELEAMLNTPSIFRNLNYGINEFENMDDNTVPENKRNEWRQDYIEIPYSRNLTGTSGNVGINPQFPYQQLDRLTVDKLLGSTSPVLKTPLEAYTGQYAYTGMDIDSPLEYLLSQTLITSPIARMMETNDSEEQKMKEISKFTTFPIATIKDQTVNKYSY